MASELQVWNRASFAAGETVPISSKADTTIAAVLLSTFADDLLREALEYHPWSWAKAQASLVEVSSRDLPLVGDGATTEFTVPYDSSERSQLAVTVGGIATDAWTYVAPADGYPSRVVFAIAPGVGVAITITVSVEREGWDYIYALPADCVRPLALLAKYQRQSLIVDPVERIPFEVITNNGGNGKLICTNEEFTKLEYTRMVTRFEIMPSAFIEALVRRYAAPLLEAIPKKPREAQDAIGSYFAWLNEAVRIDNASQGQPEVPLSPGLAARFGR